VPRPDGNHDDDHDDHDAPAGGVDDELDEAEVVVVDDDELDPSALSGELLPDWYEDWVLIEREHFRQLRLHALERLCVELTAAGRFAEATEAGLAAVQGEPLRESAHRVLISAYLAEGNPGEAVRQHAFFSRILKQQLGLEPSDLMTDLMRALPIR
jgi:DNA-binding SARP family transcriptional activator